MRQQRSWAWKQPTVPRASKWCKQSLQKGCLREEGSDGPKALKQQKYDEDADKVLEVRAKGDVQKWLQTMTIILVSMATERVGVEEERAAKLPDFES